MISSARRSQIINGAGSTIVLLALWQFASYFTPPYLFPPLQDVFARTLQIFVDLPLMVEVLETAARIFAGLFGAFFLGAILALLIGRSARFESWSNPVLVFLQGIPALSWVVIAVIWFKGSEFRIFFIRRQLMRNGIRPDRITVLGLTFKENVPDIRNSKVVDIIRDLESFGVAVQVHDPLAEAEAAEHEYGIKLCPYDSLRPADAVVLAVSHDQYVADGWPAIVRLLKGGSGVVFDIKAKLDPAAVPAGIDLWRL